MSLNVSTNTRIFSAFWLFGLVNNVLYVVNLSAAIDLVGTSLPKGIVLLPDIIPSFIIKLVAPFFVHVIPYRIRISMLVGLSFFGMITVALSDSIPAKLFGIAIASLSSGLGEISFLSLTHFYGSVSISGFSSGTGGAGLVGSFLYLALTTWIQLSVKSTLLLFSLVPVTFWAAFYLILPEMRTAETFKQLNEYPKNEDEEIGAHLLQEELQEELQDEEERQLNEMENQSSISKPVSPSKIKLDSFSTTINRLKPLVVPFMIPLFLVYIAEYIINQGISPTLLFPIEEMPFRKYRDAYVTYGTLYQREFFFFFFLIYLGAFINNYFLSFFF